MGTPECYLQHRAVRSGCEQCFGSTPLSCGRAMAGIHTAKPSPLTPLPTKSTPPYLVGHAHVLQLPGLVRQAGRGCLRQPRQPHQWCMLVREEQLVAQLQHAHGQRDGGWSAGTAHTPWGRGGLGSSTLPLQQCGHERTCSTRHIAQCCMHGWQVGGQHRQEARRKAHVPLAGAVVQLHRQGVGWGGKDEHPKGRVFADPVCNRVHLCGLSSGQR